MTATPSPTPNTKRRRRRGPALVLTGVVAAGAASLAIAVASPGGGTQAVADQHAVSHPAAISSRELDLRQAMRGLWEEHVNWTRMVIVDFADGSPGLNASAARLLRNQRDIGDAIAGYYGPAAGARLTGLLRAHILIAVDVLTAAKAGDGPALTRAQARWARNADAIATFLSSANPTAWPRPEMRAMMAAHLALTTKEAVGRLTGDFRGSVRTFDKVEGQAMDMADMLSDGIVHQFPERFR